MKLELKKFLFVLGGIFVFPLSVYATMNIPKAVEFFDLEMPLRCSVQDFKEQELSSTVVIGPNDFTVRLPAQTDTLPRYQVNSFSSRKQPVETAIQNLLSEAGIRVESEPGVYPVVSLKSLKGELSNVLEELAQKAGVFYTYNADRKVLTLKSKAQMVVQLPRDRRVVMAVVDAMAGGRFAPVSPDWENYQIFLTGTRDDLNKVRQLMVSLIKDKYLLMAQMNLYEIYPMNNVSHWQQIIADFGKSRFASSQAGVAGTLLILKPTLNILQFVAKAMNKYEMVPLAQGQMIVPSNWRVRFKLGECALDRPYNDFSVWLRSKIQNKKMAQSTLTLDTKEGEVASFDFTASLDQEAAVIGIPVQNKPNIELLLTLKFNFINLIKKGE